ncbi:energy transducer TonB family protein [Roseibacillus ishigakijimensis]|uniref:Energy transducer TonB n=1 Tax=Roseibacillus ishigakijimensis TaxID=454146 RepID=A0A934VHN1_9BACT|nr:energy transducer TonB [Roseibacillus ishigakijimensis]MBK1834153.1 energy transducer TonB [Roseibacillus ishigakijimensis]
MLLRSSLTGLVVTLLLAVLLAASRIFSVEPPETIELTEVEVIELAPPPPPPELSEPEEQTSEDLPPPPTPKIELQDVVTPDTPEIALAISEVPLTTPIQNFQTEMAPAPMPALPKPKPKPKPVAKPKPTPRKSTPAPTRTYTKPTPKPSPRPAPKPVEVTKSYYSAGELDSLPRERYTGKFRWPSSARGTSGTVKLYIEISTSGRVKVLSVVSSTDSALSSAASKIARGSRFTSPTRGGKPVKARFYKTYHLKKP